MEHLVTIAFDFDDATVTNKIHNTVEKTVIDKITAEVEGKIFEKNWGAKKVDPERDSLSWWTERIVKNLFLEHKDEIIGKAAEILADSFKRTKAFKEVAAKAMVDE